MNGPARPDLQAGMRALTRAVRRRRGLLAAGLTAAAVATALPQPAPPGAVVLAAARDLDPGSVLGQDDVVRLSLPPEARPEGALPDAPVAGLRVATLVRRGEPLTDARLLGPGLLDGASADAGLVAAPVRLADPASAALLRAGDRVDVLAASADGRQASAPLAAADVLVLAVPAPDAQLEGGLVLLATSPPTAARLAAAAVSSRLSVVLRPR